MKTCKQCNEQKPLGQFGVRKDLKDGYSNTCKSCRNTRVNERYERSGAYIGGIYVTRKTLDHIGKKPYRLTILDIVRVDLEPCKNKHGWRHKVIASCKCDCGTVGEFALSLVANGFIKSCGCLRFDDDKLLTVTKLFVRNYKRGALTRGLIFDLSHEQCFVLSQQACHYCGVAPKQLLKTRSGIELTYNGIDRKNPSIGYVLPNCVPCCKRCNIAKQDLSYEEFLQYIERLRNHVVCP